MKVALACIIFILSHSMVIANETETLSSKRMKFKDIIALLNTEETVALPQLDEMLLYVIKDEYGDFCDETKQLSAVRYLLENGASANATDTKGKRALHYANSNTLNIVTLLVEFGAHLDVQDRDGRTPLMVACENVDIPLIKHLLALGANGDIKDNNGKVASQYVPVAHPVYVDGESVKIVCMEAYELLHSYGYTIDLRGKMTLYFILGSIIYNNAYCSEEELIFLLNHGAEIEFECVFEGKILQWSMLSFIRNCPQYPDDRIYPMWRGVREHELNISENNYTTLRKIEEIIIAHKINRPLGCKGLDRN